MEAHTSPDDPLSLGFTLSVLNLRKVLEGGLCLFLAA